jgi:ABC-2 type transport system permease protein
MMRPFLTLARVEVALLTREPAAVFFTLALPVLLLALQGGDNAPDPDLGGFGAIDVMVPGYLLLVMCTSGLMALPETLATYRERGFLRRLRVSPLRPWQILGAHAVTHLTMSLVGLVLLVGVGVGAFNLNPPTGSAAAAVALVASAVAVVAIGFLLGAVLPTARTTQAVAAAIYLPAILVSGVVMPREGLPEMARRIGDALPFSYGVRAVREAWTVGTVDWFSLAALTGVAVVAMAVGVRTFRWESRAE